MILGGTRIPGTTGSEGGGQPLPFAIPSFNNPLLIGLGKRPNPALLGQQANLGSSGSFAGSAAGVFPPAKKPRTGPLMGPGPHVGQGAETTPGRGLTPSSVLDAIVNGLRAEASWEPGDEAMDFLSVQRLVVAGKDDLSYNLALKGQFVFNDRDGFEPAGRGRIHDIGRDRLSRQARWVGTHGWPTDGVSRLLPLPVLNYLLRVNDVPVEGGKYMDPAMVVKRYLPEGVVRTDPHESQHPSHRRVNVKEYTVTIAGRDPDCTNVWGMVRTMQELWLVVKRIPWSQAPSEYTLTPIDNVRRPAPATEQQQARNFHPNPIQVIPWTSSHNNRPQLADLAYLDDLQNTINYGVAVRVGWANEPSDATNALAVNAAWHDASMLMILPRVDITLKIENHMG